MASPLRQQIQDDLVFTKEIEGVGRGLFATQDIPAQAQVLLVARPLLVALESSKLSTHCYFCYKTTDDGAEASDEDRSRTLKTCSGCKTVKFCDQKCQKRAWAEYHKLECKLYARLHPRTLPSAVRAIVRLLKNHQAGLIPASEWTELLALQSHYDELLGAGGQRWQDAFIMVKGIRMYCETNHSQDAILRLTSTLLVNTFTLTNPTFDSLGMVLHPKSALLNHSCDPNAFVRFDVPPATDKKAFPPYGSISVYTLRPISKDEEITISYIDTTFHFDKRQKDLKSRYFFDCSCNLCLKGFGTQLDRFYLNRGFDTAGNEDVQDDVDVKLIENQAEQVLLDVQSKSSILHTQVDNIYSAMKMLADSRVWPIHRYPWPQLRQELFLGLLANKRYPEAMIQSAIFVRVIHPVLYPQEHHPLRVIQLWTLLKLCRQSAESLMSTATPEDMPFQQASLSLLACVVVDQLQKLLNEGTQTNGQLEKLVDAAHRDLRTRGIVWMTYRRDPEESRRTGLSWIDKQVKKELQRESVVDELMVLSASRG